MKRYVTAPVLMSIWVIFAASRQVHAADPTTADCLAASESSISLRKRHKLRDARARLLVCSAATCPDDIRNECIRRVTDVNAAMPTIVFEIKDVAGNDLSAVQVTIDGEPLVERLEGTALSIDPGSHTFTFNTGGQLAVQKNFVIREGEKERRERIVFGTSAVATVDTVHLAVPESIGVPPNAYPPTTEPARGHLSTQRIGALAAAGVGVVGLGLGIGFGLSALSRHHEAANACSTPQCDQHGVDLWDSARSAGNISTVGFVIGAVGLVGGAALWFTSKPESEKPKSTQVGLGLGTVQLKGAW